MLSDDILRFVFVYDARFADALFACTLMFIKFKRLWCNELLSFPTFHLFGITAEIIYSVMQ